MFVIVCDRDWMQRDGRVIVTNNRMNSLFLLLTVRTSTDEADKSAAIDIVWDAFKRN